MGSDDPHPDGEPPGIEPFPSAPSPEGSGFTPRTAAAIIGGIVAVVVALVLLFQGGSDDEPTAELPTPSTAKKSDRTVAPAIAR